MRAASVTGCIRRMSPDDLTSCFQNITQSSSYTAASGTAIRDAATQALHRRVRSSGKRNSMQTSRGTGTFKTSSLIQDGEWQQFGNAHYGHPRKSMKQPIYCLNGSRVAKAKSLLAEQKKSDDKPAQEFQSNLESQCFRVVALAAVSSFPVYERPK